MKSAVFCCLGLGDGLLSLILANNLKENGHEVTTFHPQLSQLESWFPGQSIQSFPSVQELAGFQRIFIFLEKTPWMQVILNECLSKYRSITTVINPIATPNTDYPFWEECLFNGSNSFADNLSTFCKTVLQLEKTTKENGVKIPSGLVAKRFPQRVILHPTSSKEEKNWPREKYLALATKLKEKGYDPIFALSPQEREGWLDVNTPYFASLGDLAAYIYESGHFIGNDSGIGHLASCLGVPTLTICRNKQTAKFWRPSWSKGVVLYPRSFIPNIKFMRLRDKYWKKSISVERVLFTFNRM